MEYLDGETLAQRLQKGALPLDQVLTVATRIAEAFDKAHRPGIVHRDLKPGNFRLTKGGAKLLDFVSATPMVMPVQTFPTCTTAPNESAAACRRVRPDFHSGRAKTKRAFPPSGW